VSDQADIQALERRFARAIAERDVDVLEDLLDHEFRLVEGGSDLPRRAALEALQATGLRALELATTAVEAYGDAALATVEGSWAEERLRITDVWIRRAGRWRLVRRHASADRT
jgi:hypothetical protein